MDYADVKEWLDILVDRYKKATEAMYLVPRIKARASCDTSVMIYEGIDIVADIMGVELKEEEFKSELGHKYYYHFFYEGVEFISFAKERLESFACRD